MVHVTVGGGVRAAGGPSFSFDLEPGISQGFDKVIVHRARDGHGVGDRLGLFVVLTQAASEVLLDPGVTGHVRCNDDRERETERELETSQ